jgi:hypothetical protein
MDDKNQSGAVAKVHEVAEQARSAAADRVDLVRDQAESAKAKAAERVRKLGHAVRKIGEHMRIEEQFYIAEQANSASQRLESVATYIDDAELGTLVRDAERLTRTNPALVLGGTFLVGLVAGRILKPSNGGAESDSEPVRALPRRASVENDDDRREPRNTSSARTSATRGSSGKAAKDAGAQR